MEKIRKFLADNPMYVEYKPDGPIQGLEDIDESDDEVWLMQYPAGMDLSELNTQKLKFPGRCSHGKIEAVALELDSPRPQAFAYHKRDGNTAMRLLPIQGNIVLRSRLKANQQPTVEQIAEMCPPMERLPFPNIRQRHPLLGAEFEDRLNVTHDIAKKLKEADNNSTRVIQETWPHISGHTRLSARGKRDSVVVKNEKESVSDKKRRKTKDAVTRAEEFSDDLMWIREC